MKVTPIPSKLPGWYDPGAPGFVPPKSWKGCRIRVRVPVGKDPTDELRRVRETLQKKYPGAVLQLVPEYTTNAAPDSVETSGSDGEVLERYFRQVDLPEGVTVEQLCVYLKQYLPGTGAFGVQGVKFIRVIAKNVLCFEKVQLNLDRKGLTLVTGRNLDWGESASNGSGKSSLVCLAFLAMFGRTFKGQTHDGWARKDSKECAVQLDLELADGSALQILRGRRPATLRVFRNSQEVTMGDVNLTQALVEQLTNLTWSVLTNAVYIGQSEVGSVFGTEKERKELFSRLLGLDRFLDAQTEIAKKVLRQQRSVEESEAEVQSAEAALREAQAGEAEIEAALSAVPKEPESEECDRNLEINELERQILRREKENKELDAQLERNQAVYYKLLGHQQDAESRSDSIKRQIEASRKVKAVCPTCGSKVSPATLEKYVENLEANRAAADVVYENYKYAMERNRTVRKALIDKHAGNAAENRRDAPRLRTLQEESTRRQGLAERRRQLLEIRDGKQTRRRVLERRGSLHQKAREAHLEEKQFLETCARAVGRDGIPAYLCASVVPQLNAAAARYSEIFAEGEIGVRFSAASGDVDVEVVNVHGGDGIKDQSQGEMRMAGLIAAFSFRDVLVPHNLLILDEPGEGLDAENAARFARGLNKVVGRFQHVIVISHNERILAEVEPDFRIEVTKQDQVSQTREV